MTAKEIAMDQRSHFKNLLVIDLIVRSSFLFFYFAAESLPVRKAAEVFRILETSFF